jgi:hypothetical protein
MLIRVSVSGDRNVITIEAENILKYKHLIIKIQACGMCKQKLQQ